ncbi:MAG: tripartite tricarboxylate transporter substrate binding protein [Clostridia bacterium]|nr:tripartite tricarboxylate transporter substrate binding protein [Clostridia bacterium]
MKKFTAIVLSLLLLIVCALASAEAWPPKTINMIVTHGAGGDTDFNARLISRLLEEKLGVTVAVTNVTGSNGNIALSQYKDGDNSGNTFIFTNTSALTGNEVTGVSDLSYEDFEPVAIYGRQSGENIIVPADAPYNTLSELIEASKQNPGSIRFGISTGGGVYIAATLLTYAGGAQFNVIDSGDAAGRLTALLGGHVDATIVPYSNIQEYIEAGQVKALCTLLDASPALIPDVPPACETVPEVIINTNYVCLAPNGTDAAIVEQLNAAILDIVYNNEEYKAEVNNFNLQEPWALSVEETAESLKAQRDLFMAYIEYLQ